MSVGDSLRTRDLAEAGGISVQQVRNYEASGFIPPAERSPSGYRRYTPLHLAALATGRALIGGYGWQRARAILGAVHRGDLPAALALLDERHAELAAERLRIEQALTALGTLAERSSSATPPRHGQRLRVGESARLVGVRVSALRFWEEQGLLHPARDAGSRYRLYDERQLRRLRVVALLRAANVGFDAIRATLDALAAGQPERAIAALERRRAEIAGATWACLAGAAALREFVSAHRPELRDAL